MADASPKPDAHNPTIVSRTKSKEADVKSHAKKFEEAVARAKDAADFLTSKHSSV